MGYKYTKEFKQEAIQLALTSSQPIAQTARDLGVKEGSLYNWVSQSKEALSSEGKSNREPNLIEENARLKEEREILKKPAQESR